MKNKLQFVLSVAFVGLVIWWLSFQHVVNDQGLSVQWFSSTYGLIALIGSMVGFVAAKRWGGFKTVLGKALMLFSLGLLAQEAGQLIYAYYIYVDKIQIPYPSWGDAAYLSSVLLYIGAAYFLLKAAGAKFSLKDTRYKFVAIAVPVILLAVSYYVLLNHHQYDTSKPLTVLLDFGYPMGQAVYVSMATIAYLLSRKTLGGVMRHAILFLILALVIQYASDSAFIYENSRGTYLSGKEVDLLYLLSYFVMSTALVRFVVIYKSLRAPAKKESS